MGLSNIIKENAFEKVKFKGEELKIKLLTESEVLELAEKSIFEQIDYCVIDNDLSEEEIQAIPLAILKELFELIMEVNKLGDAKKN